MPETRARLYLLTEPVAAAAELVPRLAAALGAADVACVLLRLAPLADRDAKSLVREIGSIVQERGAALLVEDARLAAHAGADGAHVTGFGRVFEDALASLKPERIVGIGAPLSRDDAMQAGENGADYLLFDAGPDDTERTLEDVAWWAEIFNVPCVGVAHAAAEIEPLAAAGAEFVALEASVWAAAPSEVVIEAEAALHRAEQFRAGATV